MCDSEAPAVGIDLGTTFSCIAVALEDGKDIKIIHGDEGSRIVPSNVYIDGNERVVGQTDASMIVRHPENFIYGVKRFIGLTYAEYKNLDSSLNFPYKIKNSNGRPEIAIKGDKFSPEQISSFVLEKLKERAEEVLRKKVTKAVITVPAHFNGDQRNATKVAGQLAGLEVLRIINEPTAAALAYELDNKYTDKRSNILVYDFGGGTFDVSIVAINKGEMEVLASNGEPYLGGDNITTNLANYFAKEFTRKHKEELDDKALRRLKSQAETVKVNLSSRLSVTFEILCIYKELDFIMIINKATFERINDDLFAKTITCVESTLEDAGLEKKDIDEVVLVGGSTRIPRVRQLVSNFFGEEKINKSIHPDEAVAIGAARQAAISNGLKCEMAKSIKLIDVTSLSLGMREDGNIMSIIIPRNTKLPAKKTQGYVTTTNNQKNMNISIYEGERPLVDDNRKLGEFRLMGLRQAPKGKVVVDVTFSMDVDGILKVSAVERYGDTKKDLQVDLNESGLSEEEIKAMLKAAEEFREKDAIRKTIVQATMKLQEFCYGMMDNNTIPESEKNKIDKKCQEVLEWLDQKDLTLENIEAKSKKMHNLCKTFV